MLPEFSATFTPNFGAGSAFRHLGKKIIFPILVSTLPLCLSGEDSSF